MNKFPAAILAAVIIGFFFVGATQARANDVVSVSSNYLDLTQDAFVPGGLTPELISDVLVPSCREACLGPITVSFNYDIPKLCLEYRDSHGRIYVRSGTLKAGEKLVGTITHKERCKDGWAIDAVLRWAHHCGNPLPNPLEGHFVVPALGDVVEVKTYAYVNTVTQQLVVERSTPVSESVNVTLTVCPHIDVCGGHWLLTKGDQTSAISRFESCPTVGDEIMDIVHEVIPVCASAAIRPCNTSIGIAANNNSASATGGRGGDSSSSSSSSSSASSSSSSSAAAAAGG